MNHSAFFVMPSRSRPDGLRSRRSRRDAALLAAVFLLAMTAIRARAQAPLTAADCMECHADAGIVEDSTLVVNTAKLEGSVHAGMECVDCHKIAEVPHEEELPPPSCVDCHTDAVAEYDRSIHGQSHAAGVKEVPWCDDCHGGHDITYVADDSSRVSPKNQPGTCERCHSDPAIVRKFYIPLLGPSAAYRKSAHYRALMHGPRATEGELAGAEPPTCSTCHRGHLVLRSSSAEALTNPQNVAELCGSCHASILDIYTQSVHGRAQAVGNRNAPTCVGCHGEHEVTGTGTDVPTETLIRISSQRCAVCHADQRLITAAGFEPLRVTSYRATYHGLAGQRGSADVAYCASCHGTHNIFRSNDPRSLVFTKNLVLTCGRCHEGATAKFANIRMHAMVEQETTTPAGAIRTIYLVLIAGIVGGMVLHNVVIFSRYVREKYRTEKRLRRFRRWSRFQIAQHFLLFVAFTLLAMTGFALKYPTSWWVDILATVGLNEEVRRWIHRISAVALVAQAIMQTVWFMATREGRKDIRALVPTYRDVVDFVQNIRYHLFLAERPPQYARYDYTEKAEYIALIWGTAIMALTGLVLWFPVTFTRFLPEWGFEVARVIHFYEAVLATAAIIVWHFFFTIFHPRAFPMNMTWITGTTTEHELRHHRPLEYEELRDDPNAIVPPEPQDGTDTKE